MPALALAAGLLTGVPLPGWAAGGGAIIVLSASGGSQTLSPSDLAGLPAVQVTVPFGGDHSGATFEGPLLWTVLAHAAAAEAAKPRDQLRMTVTVEGQDGYAAVLALGELLPEFEAKQVVLADKQDGQPLAPGHFRLVVPGDKRGGRSVKDVALVAVTALPAPALAP